jgi:hypothetical protein
MIKEIRLNAFDMNCVGHIQQGMWTHLRDRRILPVSDRVVRDRATGLHDLINPIDARAEAKNWQPRGAAAWSSPRKWA